MKRFPAALAISIAVAAAAAVVARQARAENDPDLEWRTIETRHFRINYEKNLEPVARRLARLGEAIHGRLEAPLGFAPAERTEILLTDTTDIANGSANVVPFNQVRLFVTAPADLSPLNDYDDWYLGLLTHEYTHILHTGNISGVSSVVNAILGRTLAPNQAQPRWFIEGLAVVAESDFSTGGRIRSTLFDAYLRADVIDDRFAGLDQISSNAQRWPQGNLWYLYGSRFLHWISEVYGRDVLRAVSADYGATLVPFGINRAIRRQTGRTYEELYEGFHDYLERSYQKQLRDVARRGLREGRRITFHGRTASYPAFVPERGRWGLPSAKTGGEAAGGWQLAYFRDDLNARSGIYSLDLPAGPPDAWGRARRLPTELVSRASDETPVSFAPDGDLFTSSTVPFKHIYRRTELFRQAAGGRAPQGDEAYRVKLTRGLRATAPAVSSDGGRAYFTVNARGTTSLWGADLVAGKLENMRQAVAPRRRFDQAFTPAVSPDGTRVAYSAWEAGGWRDLYLFDTRTGAVTALTHDRAIDAEPAWSPDGARLYFTSDRSGIFNVYALELDTGRVRQVTNVRTAAVMPAVSPDGRLLVYVGYTWAGYDLYALAIDEARFLDAPPPPEDRGSPYPEPPTVPMKRERYNPLVTLRPRSYSVDYGQGNFGGGVVTFAANGSDMVGLHAVAASVIADGKAPVPQLAFGYTYGRMPFDVSVQLANRVTPRGDYRVGSVNPPYLEKSYSARLGLVYRRPEEYATQTFGISYSASVLDSALPVANLKLDPNEMGLTTLPQRGFLGAVHLGYGIGRVEGGLDTPGPARGYSLSIGLDVADQATGSQESLYSATYSATAYVPLPWGKHHVLALRSNGGASTGSFARRGIFYVGGYNLANASPLDLLSANAFAGAFVMRGYPVGAYHGSNYALQNAEYRFPIAVPDHGPSTLPIYLRRIDGNLFLDWGGAWDSFDFTAVRFFKNGAIVDSAQLHTAVGAELWLGATAAYVVDLNFRLGYAFGFSPERIPGGQLYFLAASAF